MKESTKYDTAGLRSDGSFAESVRLLPARGGGDKFVKAGSRGAHGRRGAGHLHEDRAVGVFEDRSEQGVAGHRRFWAGRHPARISPFDRHERRVRFPELLLLDFLGAGFFRELTEPTIDIGFHAAALAGTEIVKNDLRRFGAFRPGDGKLGFAHGLHGRRNWDRSPLGGPGKFESADLERGRFVGPER